jgi:hypothetical protein
LNRGPPLHRHYSGIMTTFPAICCGVTLRAMVWACSFLIPRVFGHPHAARDEKCVIYVLARRVAAARRVSSGETASRWLKIGKKKPCVVDSAESGPLRFCAECFETLCHVPAATCTYSGPCAIPHCGRRVERVDIRDPPTTGGTGQKDARIFLLLSYFEAASQGHSTKRCQVIGACTPRLHGHSSYLCQTPARGSETSIVVVSED